MKYLQPTFSVPTSSGKLTDREYEIAVGIRNPDGTQIETACLCIGWAGGSGCPPRSGCPSCHPTREAN